MSADPADFYSGIVVDAYAALKSSSFDPAPYAAFVRRAGEPGLEIGCGDGDPLLALRLEGLDVDGVDSSADMLERCRARASSLGVEVTVHHQRMEELDLPRRYAAIYLAGPTIDLLPDDRTVTRTLAAVRRHLTDGGRALVPLWTPGATPAGELGRPRETTTDDGSGGRVVLRYTALSEVHYVATRTRTTTTRYERVTAAGTEVLEQQWVLHWHSPAGFADLAREAGLRVVAVLDDDGRPAAPDATSCTVELARQDAS